MIVSYKDKNTEDLHHGEFVRPFQSFKAAAIARLNRIAEAEKLSDLLIPPGTMLEALSGDRVGQHSIRINRQWRICFIWTEAGANDVEITDYH